MRASATALTGSPLGRVRGMTDDWTLFALSVVDRTRRLLLAVRPPAPTCVGCCAWRGLYLTLPYLTLPGNPLSARNFHFAMRKVC